MKAPRNIPPSDDRLVWYAGYGSNLLRRRFDFYIGGGTPEGSTRIYPGCRDRTAPRADRQARLPHQMYFADHSKAWGGAVAFIRRVRSDAVAYARMYLITYGQFNDVVRQENGGSVPGGIIVPPYEDLAPAAEWSIAGIRLYGRLLKTGIEDGHPVLTFTATRDDFAIGPPSEAYVKMIAAGLAEAHPCLGKDGVLDYLAGAEGIRGMIERQRLADWV